MPKVRPLIEEQQLDYEWEQLSLKIMHDCKDLKISNTVLAGKCGVTPQAISKQFQERRVQVKTILAYERLKGERGK